MQEFVHAAERVENAEPLMNPLPQILAATDPLVWIRGGAVDVRADLFFLLDGQVAMITATAVEKPVQTLGVVAVYPLLNRAATGTQRHGDLRSGSSLQGQDHHLNAIAQPALGSATQPLQLLNTVMTDDLHAGPPYQDQGTA